MHARSFKLVLVLLVVVCLGGVLPVWAQSASSGTVSGSVTDPSNAVVAAATITLTDISTSIPRTANSNASGRYFFADVTPGTYTLTVSKAGFATTKTDNQIVQVGVNLTVNLSLQVGGANVVVEVSAVGNELQTMNATVGNTINSVTIDNLPSLGRDVSTFVELQPGVGPDGSVGGAVLDQNYFSLDGGNNTNDMDGSMNVYTMSYAGDPTGGVATQNNLGSGSGGPTGVIPTPQDSVEEFKVNTAGQTADFNSSAGAEVKIVTKRGTNAWHGTGYEYYKDNNWSSQSWENNYDNLLQPGSAPLPSFHYSRYGGAIGGPIIPKEILGGKTYFFFNYEGFNFPQAQTVHRNVPSPALQQGLILDSLTGAVDYNLNNAAVVYNGVSVPANFGCAGTAAHPNPGGLCDPLGVGLNPLVSQIWSAYEPASNGACGQTLCDGANVLGFTGSLNTPQTSKFVAARLDHDFSPKWHFNATYHFYKLTTDTTDQLDIGGFFSGDTKGVPASLSSDPAHPDMWAAGLTTNITSNTTNDFHYSFLRNFWQWIRQGDTPQVAGLGGALEIMSGQTQGAANDLGPYNVNTQQTRTRYWDGHDQMVRDDVSNLRGNHLLQFGGTYQHNWNQHQRTDNGGGINYAPVYALGVGLSGSGLASDVYPCGGFGNGGATTSVSNCGALTAGALGIVSISQIAYTRSGASLSLNPPLTPAEDTLTIPYYNVYFSDTWHMKPTFTLTYGLGWTLEQPPTEATGKQDVLVDASDTPVSMTSYLAQRKAAALIGQVYNPVLGFALVHNVGDGSGRVYDPYYAEFSPRIAVAWSPHFDADSMAGKIFGHEDTVIRGGYGRVYGRLNGVDQALVPLLGVGPIQPVQCANNLANGSCPSGAVTATPGTAFRIGATENGLIAPLQTATNLIPSTTLPQPLFTGINSTEGSASESLDPHFRPNMSDSFNLTIQRQLTHRVTLELGYIGRRITHEYQPINLNAVPYMMTLGGQQFKQAYANTVLQYCGGIAGLAGGGCAAVAGNVTPQPFFEAALGGTSSAYCHGFSSCTAAVVANEGGNLANAQVWSLWSDLDAGPMQTANGGALSGPTMLNNSGQFSSGVASNGSIGYGNYNGGFASLKMADWRGLTLQSNFTWSKALGTGGVVQASSEITPDDPFNLATTYGYQDYDRKFVYNVFFVYQLPFYKGQHGFLGRALGGWSVASVFTAGSGSPIEIFTTTGDGQEYGAGDNINFFGNENAIQIAPIKAGHAYYNNPSGALPVNLFKQGISAISDFRNPILGLDNKDGGNGNFFGLPYWNMDFSVRKNIVVAEGVSLELQGVFADVLNHNQWLDPVGANAMGLFGAGTFGALGGSAQEQIGGDRQIEIGARLRF
jgi:Carboxypeptidase regulatory-like domain